MLLSDLPFPPDRRVEREAQDLIRDGHEIYLLARQGKDQSSEEIFHGIHVIRIRWPFLNRHKWLSELVYWLFQRYWIYFTILKVCRTYDIEAIHVHDLPYAYAASCAAEKLGIPMIFDSHENYPLLFQIGFQSRHSPGAWFFLKFICRRLIKEQAIVCRRAAKIVVVVQEHIALFSGPGAGPDKFIEVTNTENPDYFKGLSIDESIVRRYQDCFVLLYIGGFGAERGLETAFRALPEIRKAIPSGRLLLVGSGYRQPSLEALSRELGIEKNVEFAGYQPFTKLPGFISAARIGIIPHVWSLYGATMPNKLFQFMMLGLPVVVSDDPALRRVVEDARGGLVFRQGDPASFAQQVLRLGQDPALRKQLGENGRTAVQNKYNWPLTVQPLLNVYKGLAQKQNKG